MNKLLYAAIAFAALGLAAGTNVAVAAKTNNNLHWGCVTDDGYGRLLPCSYGYQKRADRNNGNNLNWDCFTDDGYGRKLPCDYGIKRRR